MNEKGHLTIGGLDTVDLAKEYGTPIYVMDEGLGLDVVSEGELYTAASVGFPIEKVCFHGNNKTDGELSMALEKNVGRIIVDNIFELERLNKLACERNIKANIMFRIKPGIDAHTHYFIRTGQIDSKFGFALETGEGADRIRAVIEEATAFEENE